MNESARSSRRQSPAAFGRSDRSPAALMNSRSPSGRVGRNSNVDESLFGMYYLLVLTVLI